MNIHNNVFIQFLFPNRISDREKVLARRRKFESSQTLVKPEKKVISLKTDSSSSAPIPLPLETSNTQTDKVGGNTGLVPAKKVKRLISEDQGDAISLSVDDTLVNKVIQSSLHQSFHVCVPMCICLITL